MQMLDMVQPKEEGRIRLQDLKSCSLTPIFFDTFINLDKYLEHEQKDPFSSVRVKTDCTAHVSAVVESRGRVLAPELDVTKPNVFWQILCRIFH